MKFSERIQLTAKSYEDQGMGILAGTLRPWAEEAQELEKENERIEAALSAAHEKLARAVGPHG